VVAAGASFGSSEISVVSGLQVATSSLAFQTQSARPGFPFVSLPVVNADPGQQTIYPGTLASITGQNLSVGGSALVTLNDIPVTVQSATGNQIFFQIPANFPTGLATLKLVSGGFAAFPVTIEIDNAPPTIVALTNNSNVALAGITVTSG